MRRVDIAAGLSAAMHDQPGMSTLVSDGLLAHGQRELVITLRGATEQQERTILDFFARVAEYAAEGRIVDIGDFTQFGPTGFLGRRDIRGIMYLAAQPVEGLHFPCASHLMTQMLVGAEMETAREFGTMRMMARLGQEYKHYPCPPWWEPGRQALADAGEQSVLAQCPRVFARGGAVRMDGPRIRLRVPRGSSWEGLKEVPRESALGVLTTPDADADGCLVWRPGQKGPSAITPPGSAGRQLSGCFVLFAPEQGADEGRIFEDGFAVMLRTATWEALRAALAAGEPFRFESSTGYGFELEQSGS